MNISQSLDPSFCLPTDVTFQIVSSGNEVKAHKYVLALGSPVFKKQFFGDAKETKDVIPIPKTTEESFKTMIYFVYGKEIDLKKMTVDELFSVANMAEKYDIEVLMKEVRKVLEDFDISEENVVTIASTAQEFGQFEDISKALFLHCAKFLKSVLKTPDDFVTFAVKHANTDMSETALSLIAKFPDITQYTDGCGQCGKVCRRGKGALSYEQIVVGDRVKINDQGRWDFALNKTWKHGEVSAKYDNNKTVGVKLDDGSTAHCYYVVFENVPVFLYDSC